MARSQDDGGFCKYIIAMSLVIYERREYRQNGFVYLLDDEEKTAWIKQGRIKRCRRYRLNVPANLVEQYREHPIWGVFQHILPIEK